MKTNKYAATLAAALLSSVVSAEVILFDLSPPGTSPEVGLSPENEVPLATGDGSGGELPGGISFDTDTGVLSYAIGYGSVAGFSDLTGPATAAHIHGPAPVTGTAPPLHDFFAAGDHLPAPDPATGGVIMGSVMLDESQAVALRDGLYYINIHTEANMPGEIRGQLIEMTNSPPTVSCPEPVTVECESPEGTQVTLVAEVSDEDGDPLTVVWMINGEEFSSEDVPSGGKVTESEVSLEAIFGLGEHTVVVMVMDDENDPVTCETTVTVEDTTPPDIISITPSRSTLWPPNHKMHSVSIEVEAVDVCGEVTSQIVSVESTEPENGIGDGNTPSDWEITGDLEVDLRAERSGPGDGREYTIVVEVSDESGNVATSTTVVEAPKSQGKKRGSSLGRSRRGR